MEMGQVRRGGGRLGGGYSTLKHWSYEGRVRTRVTSGGDHRIADSEIDRLLAPATVASPRAAAERSGLIVARQRSLAMCVIGTGSQTATSDGIA